MRRKFAPKWWFDTAALAAVAVIALAIVLAGEWIWSAVAP